MSRAALLFAVLAVWISAGANAAILTFTDRTVFIATTGATSLGAIPFSASSANFDLGGLTFGNVSGSSFARDRNWSTLISEPFDLAISGVENFNVISPGPLFSFGFEFHEPSASTSPQADPPPDTCNTTCVDSTFAVTLLDGATIVGVFPFNATDDLLTFVGLTSTLPFNRIEIRETAGTNDNEFFGNFLIGRTPVPEPATLALLAVALLGIGVARRRRPA